MISLRYSDLRRIAPVATSSASSNHKAQRASTGIGLTVTGGPPTPTGTLPEQRAAAGQVGSPPPLAVAVLLPVVAVGPTPTVSTNEVLAVDVSVPVKVQLSAVVPLQVQLEPAALTSVIPVRSVSLSAMLPVVAAVPVLVTVIV
jgi:hypothetical protein